MKKIQKVLLGIFLLGLLVFIGIYYFNNAKQQKLVTPESKEIHKEENTKSGTINVGVINPTAVVNSDIVETTYLGEVLSEKNGKIYSYRAGIIDKFIANVGDVVKEGQIVAKLLPAQFNPDLANMIVEKKTMKIKALGMVKSADLTLKSAIDRKNKIFNATQLMIDGSKNSVDSSKNIKLRIGDSTQNKLDKTIIEQDAKIQKIKASLDSINTGIIVQEKNIENIITKTDAGVNLEDSKLKISAGNIKTSVANAYNTIIRVFYASSYNQTMNSSNFNGRYYFGAKDQATINQFSSSLSTIYPKIIKIGNLSQEEIFTLAKDTLQTIDAGLKVLDNTIISADYNETMLNNDKTMLIMAKTDQMNGIQTNLNMYNEQLSMLSKEKNIAGADVSDEKLMLEKLSSEKFVMEKDLIMAIAEKDRMLSETQNDKIMAENEALKMEAENNKMLAGDNANQQMSLLEAEKMIVEAQKMLIDAKADLESANVGLNLFEGAGFSNDIKAPFSGKITKKYINVGESIGVESPIFDIVQEGNKEKANIFVRFEIPESEFGKAKVGQEVSFFRTIEPLKKYSATIKRVSPAINTTTKGVIVEAIVSGNESENVLIGASIRVNIVNNNDKLFSIPIKTIKQDEKGNMYIFKVLKNKIEKQIIKTSRTYGDSVFVTEGLKVGTKVIVDDKGMVLEVGAPVTYNFISSVKSDSSSKDELIDEHSDGGGHAH